MVAIALELRMRVPLRLQAIGGVEEEDLQRIQRIEKQGALKWLVIYTQFYMGN